MYVIDLTHYLDTKGAIAPERGPARKMADFLTAVVAHASDFDRSDDAPGPVCFKCRKRDQRVVETGSGQSAQIDGVAVAGKTGTAEVGGGVRAHAWFTGFAPGFAYLVDGDPRLRTPRRTEPRTVVPAGSVGLAGAFSGIYPRSSPGGWQLIGRTDAALFDVDRDPPALLRPGAWVRFVSAP